MTRNALVSITNTEHAAGIVDRLLADGLHVAVIGPEVAGAETLLNSEAEAAIAEWNTRFRSLDVLITDIVSPVSARFSTTSPDEWFDGVRLALSTPFKLIRAAVPALTTGSDARIVVVGNGWGAAEAKYSTGAAATQGAAVALVKTLARDLGPIGVTVNQLAVPGDDRADVGAVARGVSYFAAESAGATTGQILTLGPGGPVRP